MAGGGPVKPGRGAVASLAEMLSHRLRRHIPVLPFAPHTARGQSLPEGGFSWWSLGLVLAVSAVYESLFLHRGLSPLDEAWPLYAAMRLRAGGTLYHDVLWVFPPGHLLVAWIAYVLDPPGVLGARIGYSAFTVALVGALYVLARRLMPEPFALLAGLLVAVAAPLSHAYQMLFGYRYLVLSVLTLLAFDQRRRGGSARWMAAAGALVGLSFTFRQDPFVGTSAGVAVGMLASWRGPRRFFADGAVFAASAAAVVLPVIAWHASSVGLARLWQEVVIHPFAMLQPLPLPELVFPAEWDRRAITRWFIAFQFRAIWALYTGYVVALAWLGWRAWRRREEFRHGLLAAVMAFGAIFFIRSTGRSDAVHLDSAIPPVCLLVAHLISVAFARLAPAGAGARRLAAGAVVAGALASWVFLMGTDRGFVGERRTYYPVESLEGATLLTPREKAADYDFAVRTIARRTRPGDTILSLSHAPIFYLLTGRLGAGWSDVIMPGTFLTESDEIDFVKRLEASPPAAVVMWSKTFDKDPERSVTAVAPRVTRWVQQRYAPAPRPRRGEWIVLLPRPGGAPGAGREPGRG